MKPTIKPPPWQPARQALHALWQQRSPRERRLLQVAAVLLLGAGLWQFALGPAWSVWRDAPKRQADIDAQTRHMRQLQAEARQWQAAPPPSRTEALRQLQAGAERLLGPGAALQPQGEQVRLTLQGATAEGLAEWLALARTQALTRPLHVELQRRDVGDAPPVWQGQMTLRLP